jgi:hypothetical protein
VRDAKFIDIAYVAVLFFRDSLFPGLLTFSLNFLFLLQICLDDAVEEDGKVTAVGEGRI